MTVRVRRFTARGRDREIELADIVRDELTPDELVWVDVEGEEGDAVADVAARLDLSESVIDGLRHAEDRARLEQFSQELRVRMVAAQDAAGGRNGHGSSVAIEMVPVDIVAAANLVLTVHERPVTGFEEFVEHIHGDTRLGTLDAASFMTALLDSVLTIYLQLVEGVERRVDALDEQALRSKETESYLNEVVVLRRRVALLRRLLAPMRVTLAPLGRPDLEIPGLGQPWPGLLDRLERVIDTVENARELIIGSFDVFMARNAERTNDIMKTLTILNAVLLPAVVVAGVMGMNFGLGFFKNENNFWFVIGAMVTLATLILGFSRWRRWI
jgi:Mg2+ and Co2+ transporter CorA